MSRVQRSIMTAAPAKALDGLKPASTVLLITSGTTLTALEATTRPALE